MEDQWWIIFDQRRRTALLRKLGKIVLSSRSCASFIYPLFDPFARRLVGRLCQQFVDIVPRSYHTSNALMDE
jgi:hypothetical protein